MKSEDLISLAAAGYFISTLNSPLFTLSVATYHNVSRTAFWERNEEYGNDLYMVSQRQRAQDRV